MNQRGTKYSHLTPFGPLAVSELAVSLGIRGKSPTQTKLFINVVDIAICFSLRDPLRFSIVAEFFGEIGL